MYTALEYAMHHPEHRVAILERGLLPTGASTKNAGFACFGSISELEDDLKTLGPDALASLVVLRYEGLQRMRALLTDTAIDYRSEGGYELLFDPAQPQTVEYFNDLLEVALGKRPFRALSTDGFGFGPQVTGLIENQLEGSVHTGKMVTALQRKIFQAGIQLYTGAEVVGWEEHGTGISVDISTAGGPMAFNTQQLAICNNAFAASFLPAVDLSPGRGTVLVTKPIPGWNLKGTFHYHSGYHYFRSIDGRLLLGGGRQLDFEGEQTTSFEANERIVRQLETDLRAFIVPDRTVEIDYTWSGIMAFGKESLPFVERISPRIVAGVRLGGMGVAIASTVGHDVARLLRH